jgi:hypothetical protein
MPFAFSSARTDSIWLERGPAEGTFAHAPTVTAAITNTVEFRTKRIGILIKQHAIQHCRVGFSDVGR